tara:strand:+ start:2807 stop:3235 length:429 start_codon:yes stop_codon:yes gene_type:complete
MVIQDFAYRFIENEGGKTTDEILGAFRNHKTFRDKKFNLTKSTRKQHISIRELSMSLTKSRLFFREKVYGRNQVKTDKDGKKYNLNRWFNNDVKVIAKKLATTRHLRSKPNSYPKVLRDEYYGCLEACEAETAGLNKITKRG